MKRPGTAWLVGIDTVDDDIILKRLSGSDVDALIKGDKFPNYFDNKTKGMSQIVSTPSFHARIFLLNGDNGVRDIGAIYLSGGRLFEQPVNKFIS
jgi:hypothetical protein